MTKKDKGIKRMFIPYKEFDIEAYKSIFVFWQVKVRKAGKVVYFSRADQEFVNWDQAAKHAIEKIDNGEIQ